MEKMEKVEALRNKAGVTYEEAKAALEANNWDVLDAMIALEKEGKVKQTSSSKAEVLTGDVVTENGQKSSSEPKRRKFMNWIKDILRKANRNAFEVSKDGKIILACRGDGPFATAIAHCHGIEPMGDGRGKRIVPTAINYR